MNPTVFTIIVDSAWLASLVRQLFELLRKAEPEHIKSTAEYVLENDNDDKESQQLGRGEKPA